MNQANQLPTGERQKPSARFAVALGRLVGSKEVTPVGVDWAIVAAKSRRIEPKQPNSDKLGTTQLSFTRTSNGPEAIAVTADRKLRKLQGVMFAGRERYGLVTESTPGKDADSFYITALGEGQKSAIELRQVDLDDPGMYKAFNIGRQGKESDDIVTVDSAVSRDHAEVLVLQGAAWLTDHNSTYGTTLLTANFAHQPGADPMLAEAWQEMCDKPELWSGEFKGGTVVRAQ